MPHWFSTPLTLITVDQLVLRYSGTIGRSNTVAIIMNNDLNSVANNDEAIGPKASGRLTLPETPRESSMVRTMGENVRTGVCWRHHLITMIINHEV